MLKIIVGVLLSADRQQVLIARRPEGKAFAGYWEFPGGKVEPAESERDALSRELREEVGIDVRTAAPLFAVTRAHAECPPLYLAYWLVSDFDGDPYGAEQQEIAWVRRDALPAYRMPESNMPVQQLLAVAEQPEALRALGHEFLEVDHCQSLDAAPSVVRFSRLARRGGWLEQGVLG